MQEEPTTRRGPSDHRIAIHNFSGGIRYIEADEVVFCIPTRECVQFWATLVGALLSIGIGIFFMTWKGDASVYFPIGAAMLGTGLGVLLPSPNYKTLKPGRVDENENRNEQ